MDKKDLFTAGIFLIGFLSLLLVSFNTMLAARITPIKEDIYQIGVRIDRIETRIDQVETRMATHINRLNDKLDKLILLQVQKQSYRPHFIPRKKKSPSRGTSSQN